MSFTHYQSKFIAHYLTLEGAPEESIPRALAGARVDMNPHQVEAALFAIGSPLSKGAILADEVGLGKTIEASLVLAQRWAERKRRLLLIVPATLRKQWAQELADKFHLRSRIIEAKAFNADRKAGHANPFDRSDAITIASYQFAAQKRAEVAAVPWDLVVFDEAHKLRNVWRKDGNKTAKALADAVRDRQKVLLSATPLQNSLMELFGLVQVIDPHLFGHEDAFRKRFVVGNTGARNLPELKQRLAAICTRTLRRHVQAEGGIDFTKRLSITEDFTPSDEEQRLYEEVSTYLQRDDIKALAANGRHLTTLVIRKILASSSFAIAGTLDKMIARMERALAATDKPAVQPDDLGDYEAVEDTKEELDDANGEGDEAEADRKALEAEVGDLRAFRAVAQGIKENAKGDALLRALARAFDEVERLDGQRKAVIFTESVRTQTYLRNLLAANGYKGKIVLINGGNTDAESQAIYRAWLDRHAGSDRISGSKTADTKAAIVEAFRDDATILIATEAGAEGVNLQFCSLLLNYDLPWNPQRVEQRIGRCHRYGQKCDVVVVNFINRRNQADQRVFQLLDQKFRLFDGVFGASDEILGALESGVDIEQRILAIYQQCRTAEDIARGFEQLQLDLDGILSARETETRRKVLEHFDEEVAARLKGRRETTKTMLSEIDRCLLALVRAELPEAEIDGHGFRHVGRRYCLDWREAEERNGAFFHPEDETLAAGLIATAKARALPLATLRFRLDDHGARIAPAEPLRGRAGWLMAARLTLRSLTVRETLLLAGQAEDGEVIAPEVLRRLLLVPATVEGAPAVAPPGAVADLLAAAQASHLARTREDDQHLFDAETEKLDRWAEEAKEGARLAIDALDAEIREANKAVRKLATLEEKAAAKRRVATLKQRRDRLYLDFHEEQRRIEEEQQRVLDEIEARMAMTPAREDLFLVRWEVA